MRQLVQLRWLAAAGQLLTILIVRYRLGVPLPLEPMLIVVAALGAVNLLSLFLIRRQRVTNWGLFLSLGFDVCALTVQFYLSGGADNPFVSLYLLQVVLGAVLLDIWSASALVALTAAGFALLTRVHQPLLLPPDLASARRSLFLFADWLCFALVAVLLVMFIGRIGGILRHRDASIAELRRRAAEEDGIVRMGLLASGAAHELGTPLASLSVILSDWRRDPRIMKHPGLAEEIADMVGEVDRCKAIVTGVLQQAGEPRGIAPEPVGAAAFLTGIAEDWRALYHNEPLFVDIKLDEDEAIIADPALRQAIWNVLENARDASPGQVVLVADRQGDALKVTVSDRGDGFPPELLASLGQPVQSSKGAGHGVGLFLTSNVVRKLGGQLMVENRERGAAVTMTFPLATIGANEVARKWKRNARSSS
ncbi:HAMP domain-containing histidine kinase [Sphingosinicella sp. BN140058]|nr:HAMP domain-containing histidine kinase [Sphingosinicella sp. BN140058]